MYRNYCSKYIIRCRCGKGEPAGKVKASQAIGREANKTVLQRHVASRRLLLKRPSRVLILQL